MAPFDFVTLLPLIVVGGGIPFYFGLLPALSIRDWADTRKGLVKGISIGFLLFIFVDLLLESGTLGLETRNASIEIGLTTSFSFGFLFLVALEALFRKEVETTKQSISFLSVAYLWSLGLAFHSLAEGIVIGTDFFSEGLILTWTQALSFGLHKAFEGFTVAVLLSSAKEFRSRDVALLGAITTFSLILGSLLSLIQGFAVSSTYWFALGGGASMYALLKTIYLLGKEREGFRLALATLFGIILWYVAGLLHEI